MNPRDLKIEDFDYELPDEQIAKYPLVTRDASKILYYKNGTITNHIFRELPGLLNTNDLLVFNDSRVIHARLIFFTVSVQRIEIFCLQPIGGYAALSDHGSGACEWECLIGGNRKWKQGNLILSAELPDGNQLELQALRLSEHGKGYRVRFSWRPVDLSFSEVLENVGRLPIPPYLNRDTEEEDELRYQTVFAKNEGSVAAPTAGLHFTDSVFADLKSKGIQQAMLTLHVGAGTFLPVKAESMSGHEMHDEAVLVSKTLLEQLRQAKRVIAVGTTSLRSLESLYWLSLRLTQNKEFSNGEVVGQWDPYELDAVMSRADAIEYLYNYIIEKDIEEISFRTSLMIAPPYQLKVADALITNFHQPRSTLLLLVAAVCGDDWKRIYRHALQHRYRFLSYGDSSLLEKGRGVSS